MKDDKQNLWAGLNKDVQELLTTRNYTYNEGSLALRLSRNGVEAGQLAAADRADPKTRAAWIPGVELFARTIHAQRYRGMFGEFARRDQGLLAQIGLWPAQWATARMFANTAKGFHIHPPSIPSGQEAATWLQKLFAEGQTNYSDRLYEREQWDVIFFVQGRVEMILRDARAGLPPRTMRFFIDGDNHRNNNNVGVVVPPGVAHAIRVEGSEEVIMVYGTSTAFNPEFEGRIASEIETAALPESWGTFLGQSE